MIGGWFIAGTDTEVGKTWVAECLLLGLKRAGRRAAGMKPVASGCHRAAAGLRSEDAERMREAGGADVDYADLNPYAFEPPIAPHTAATRAGVTMQLGKIKPCFDRIAARVDWLVVEGAGGWRVPLNHSEYMSDLARMLNLPVILVVAIRLGCINHALLSAAAIQADGLPLAGWVANNVAPCLASDKETIAAVDERIEAPCLAVLPYGRRDEQVHYGDAMLARLDASAAAMSCDDIIPD